MDLLHCLHDANDGQPLSPSPPTAPGYGYSEYNFTISQRASFRPEQHPETFQQCHLAQADTSRPQYRILLLALASAPDEKPHPSIRPPCRNSLQAPSFPQIPKAPHRSIGTKKEKFCSSCDDIPQHVSIDPWKILHLHRFAGVPDPDGQE